MCIVVVFIEGLRREWVRDDCVPTIARLAAGGVSRPLRDIPGTVGLRAAVFHGARPQASGLAFAWERDPARAQLRGLRWAPAWAWRAPLLRALVETLNAARARAEPPAAPLWDISGFPPHVASRFRCVETRTP